MAEEKANERDVLEKGHQQVVLEMERDHNKMLQDVYQQYCEARHRANEQTEEEFNACA